MSAARFLRRARPALGTLVELGVGVPVGLAEDAATRRAGAAFERAWRAVEEVERAMSRFRPDSDVGRFNAAAAGEAVRVGEDTAEVLRAARALERESDGLFDVAVGTGAGAWALTDDGRLEKRAPGVRLDLGGIAKGHAVDRAFEALAAAAGEEGEAACWVNAGGDLRVRGVELPVRLRDERGGGAWPWLRLREGAVATSWFGPGRLAGGAAGPAPLHVSVVSPSCLWCDALTKVVALTGRTDHPALERRGAAAWIHPAAEARW